ncbi:PDGLE domain-containing protein [Methanocaldococcus sp. 28A]
MNFDDPLVKKFVYIIIALIICCPIGILLVWNYGDAWGEWDVSELAKKVHANIQGMEELSGIWSYAILPDYDIPGWDTPLKASIGYIISAIVGVILCIIAYYGLVKFVYGNNPS